LRVPGVRSHQISQDKRHMKVVRLSALRTGLLYPQINILWYSFLLESHSIPGPHIKRKQSNFRSRYKFRSITVLSRSLYQVTSRARLIHSTHTHALSYKDYKKFNGICSFFWVIPRRLSSNCRRFGTHYRFHLHRQVNSPAYEDGTDSEYRNVGN